MIEASMIKVDMIRVGNSTKDESNFKLDSFGLVNDILANHTPILHE